ncbi:MAG: enoyl-CoA hydratase/isomerase family protein, partial [bacterium]
MNDLTELQADVLRVEESEEGVVHLILNRPDKRNALNGALVTSLARALRATGEDDGVRVLVLRGEGPDFCSGADLAELEEMAGKGAEASLADAVRMGELFLDMRRHPRPIVASVRGRALAGGCGLATACDMILAEEGAEFGFPEVHLGFVPAMVMTLLRRKVTEGRAFELVTMGERIPAQEARRLGLVNRVFAEGGLEEGTAEVAGAMASRPSSAIYLTKRLLYGLD